MGLGRVKAGLLGVARRGRPIVIWPGEGLGFGNYLYWWQAAWHRQQQGVVCRVRHEPRMERWLATFPRIAADLDVPVSEVGFRDGRDVHDHMEFGVDYDACVLDGFVRACLLSAPLFAGAGPETDPGALTVNVRRGDYYAVPALRHRYGFDVAGYVRAALERTLESDGPVTSVHVVSDGIDWCREHLAWLGDDGRSLTFAGPEQTPEDHFRRVCTSRRLVLANSTFSYWAGYVSNVAHGDNHALVYAPWFHRRDIDGGRAWQLDPHWSVVRDLAGGWDERR